MMLKLKAYNCDATPNKIEIMRSSIYRLVNIVGDDGKIIYIAGGYPKKLWDVYLEKQIDNLNLSLDSEILVVNDIALELVNQLIIKGFTKLTILGTDQDLLNKINRSLNIVYYYDNSVININTISMENLKIMNKHFNLIIANPPYELGNEVTEAILKNIDFKHYINLMPISKTKKNEVYKHITDVEIIPVTISMFDDAMVNPHIIIMQKETNEKSWDDIQLLTYDQKWIKYYTEQLNREASWETVIDTSEGVITELCEAGLSMYLTVRTGVDGVHKTENCLDYQFNKNNIWSFNQNDKYHFPNRFKDYYGGVFSTFKTLVEKQNAINYWYASKIMTPIVRGLNKQGSVNTKSFLPKVDWNRPWTDEEILRDYGYTDEEIKEILYEA